MPGLQKPAKLAIVICMHKRLAIAGAIYQKGARSTEYGVLTGRAVALPSARERTGEVGTAGG
ncbi:MAG: hypothetical protein ACRDGF_02095 [Chloroflexota bacterium]